MDRLDFTRRFDSAADAYASGRPGYPPQIADWLIEQASLEPGARVLELGAGTGELTAILLAAGLAVEAIEPSAPMRAVLAARFPGAPVVDEPAESLSAPDGTFDLVAAANALHWFDPDRAFGEISRVLREGACLAVIWNTSDPEDALQGELGTVYEMLPEGSQKTAWGEDGVARWDEFFETVATRSWKHVHRLAAAGVGDFVASWSAVANLSDAQRAPVLARVREITGDRERELHFIASVTLVRPRLGAAGPIA